jgi:diguanylate cyclase (GGDEF)-like protein
VRTGGDEFLIVLPATGASGAGKIASRILERVRGLSFGDAREPLRVTISGGVALADGTSTVESLTHEADRNLYAAKRAGRDGIHVPELTPAFEDAPLLAFRDRRRQAGL